MIALLLVMLAPRADGGVGWLYSLASANASAICLLAHIYLNSAGSSDHGIRHAAISLITARFNNKGTEMECLFAVLQLCLFDPSTITVTGDVSWQVSGASRYSVGSDAYTGSLGRLEVMVTVPFSRELSLRYGLEHRSYAETDRDRGEERAVLGFIWRPFDR